VSPSVGGAERRNAGFGSGEVPARLKCRLPPVDARSEKVGDQGGKALGDHGDAPGGSGESAWILRAIVCRCAAGIIMLGWRTMDGWRTHLCPEP
jgi:hypothetical protein